jgi:nitroreductase
MDSYEAIITRASPLELGDPAPDKEVEEKLVAAALRAPDHGRLRPWRFLFIRGRDRARFGEILAESLDRRDRMVSPEQLERERQKALRAPLIIVAAARIVQSPKIPAVEQMLSAAAAVQNILIASHALGFGAMWKTGDAAYDAEVKKALGLEPNDEIVAFIYIGTPKVMPKIPAALDPKDFARAWPAQ